VTDQPRKRAPRKTAAKAEPVEPPESSDQVVEDPLERDNTAEVIAEAAQAAATAQAAKAPPTVQVVGKGHSIWHLVTHGTWEVSVGPDGLLMLPRHLHPREVDDFIAAAAIAAQIGADIIAENGQKSRKDVRLRATARRGGAIVTEGEPPDGTVRMQVSQQQTAATIGRPRRGERPTNPMTSGRAVG